MIEIKDMLCCDEVIVTGLEYGNVLLNKKIKLKKREKESILYELGIRRGVIKEYGEEKANECMLKFLRCMRPSIRHFKRFREFGQLIYDVEAILNSDKVEFNLVKYFNMVCSMGISELSSRLECEFKPTRRAVNFGRGRVIELEM